jgi:hypothetical protein
LQEAHESKDSSTAHLETDVFTLCIIADPKLKKPKHMAKALDGKASSSQQKKLKRCLQRDCSSFSMLTQLI